MLLIKGFGLLHFASTDVPFGAYVLLLVSVLFSLLLWRRAFKGKKA
ncbi:hypothetical protein [Paenibacillus sedimenti]|uniref:Uncharacterized protein n=1 Tax=Paenibacillus sedimenti TaxID=2770274 RepID=A0A926KMI9_9BACL|nr:hypothetical protein [Paenibacillus sedimenti]MBD0379863.1 hypothetical protein [Paenibacillus sedimenti]